MSRLKKALFYTIVRRYGTSDIMAVTTEKRRQYFGRWVSDDSGTHVSIGDTSGRFATAAEAEARVAAVRRVKERYKPLLSEANRELSRIYSAEEQDIRLACEGRLEG